VELIARWPVGEWHTYAKRGRRPEMPTPPTRSVIAELLPLLPPNHRDKANQAGPQQRHRRRLRRGRDHFLSAARCGVKQDKTAVIHAVQRFTLTTRRRRKASRPCRCVAKARTVNNVPNRVLDGCDLRRIARLIVLVEKRAKVRRILVLLLRRVIRPAEVACRQVYF